VIEFKYNWKTKQKVYEGLVEWLKCLPSKNEALSSNPNTSNSKKKKYMRHNRNILNHPQGSFPET
jgi:hypothetical protein